MQRLNERVSPTRALHQDNTLTRSLIKTTLAFGHATRTTLAFGHATRTTFPTAKPKAKNLQLSTFNLQL
ncbi:hypothetical protein [Moorena bouillonii]|uniref:hypothetical protein n=1 Tax=Moorena bouillonii TaxID=207920 RepID=UPI0011803BA2|nr:hypothetical protein [Moorena bouillonii]